VGPTEFVIRADAGAPFSAAGDDSTTPINPAETVRTALKWENIPAGATGCRLQVTAPSTWYSHNYEYTNVDALHVVDVDSATMDWDNQPVRLLDGRQMPTWNFPPSTPESIIWSEDTCGGPDGLSFLFRYRGVQTNGADYDFVQGLDGVDGSGDGGFSIIYNC
jgi:hypothetical protein